MLLLIPVALASPHRVLIDPGHGEPDNPGNTGATCLSEQDEMLRVALELEERLEPEYEVRLTREGEDQTGYAERVASAGDAEVFLSLHSDARATSEGVEVDGCMRNLGHPGFTILVSDEPEDRDGRLRLARSLADGMLAEDFVAYDGRDYKAAYDAEGTPGVFLDRRGLRMLRRPTMPSVIIETHHAWDPAEVEAWQQEETMDRFARAVDAGLDAYFASPAED
ncbi:MAG TPA: N-acetylmuramoyl-L-alanine amidase [Myxococcota bacterium]|nr:N-acetylmuramoyl-L-alanine amidase [Myxococcota bacterium]